MQQNERIELIKAAAMLTAASMQTNESKGIAIIKVFERIYDYLQLKLEASGNTESN